MNRLLDIMATLRDPQKGCEWDVAQTAETIVPHTIEEAYEVADAVGQGDSEALRDELGDLLFQVVFQARIAEEAGAFRFDDVVTAVSDKLEARHPHIFGSETLPGGMQEARWETLKERERAAKGETSAMDGVATALPALLRAEKLQKRAKRDGFRLGRYHRDRRPSSARRCGNWPKRRLINAKKRQATCCSRQSMSCALMELHRKQLCAVETPNSNAVIAKWKL